MNLLLDTHILLWWLAADPRLSDAEQTGIVGADSAWVSVASAWEIGLKRTLGKLDAPPDLADQLTRHGFAVLPMYLDHALRIGELPQLHRDPFDRMLIAQAQIENLVIVTRDERIAQYDVQVFTSN